jgi:hypothetical protein
MKLKIIVGILLSCCFTTAVQGGETRRNLIKNPGLEQMKDGLPLHWYKGEGYGHATAQFEYPVPGYAGSRRAAKLTITEYIWGDRKWYFKEVPVQAGETYVFRNRYKGTIPSNLTAEFIYADGHRSYRWLVNPPASRRWRLAQSKIKIPEGVVAVRVFHSLTGVGELTVDAYSLMVER